MVYIFILSWMCCSFINAGILFPDINGRNKSLSKEFARIDLGYSILFGIFFGFLSLVGIFVVLCITGFAEKGFYFTPRNL